MRLLALAPLLLLTACGGGGLTDAQKADRCGEFADKVVVADLAAGTPDEKTARDVAGTLDPLLSRLSTPAVHDPAVRVHQQLHAVELAAKRGDDGQADKAAEKAKDAVTELAGACGLPESRFLGNK